MFRKIVYAGVILVLLWSPTLSFASEPALEDSSSARVESQGLVRMVLEWLRPLNPLESSGRTQMTVRGVGPTPTQEFGLPTTPEEPSEEDPDRGPEVDPNG